jgi:hypothetical protein
VRVGDIPHTAVEMPTFHRIEWWPNEPGMVKAAHTVMSCCSMTFGQHQIVSAVAKQTKRPPAQSWWVQKLSADFTAD